MLGILRVSAPEKAFEHVAGQLSGDSGREGRVKIPADFLAELRTAGSKFYVTSDTGEYARIYPMKAWEEIEEKLAKFSSHNPAQAEVSGAVQLLRSSGRGGWAGANFNTPVLRESAQMREKWTSQDVSPIWKSGIMRDSSSNMKHNPITGKTKRIGRTGHLVLSVRIRLFWSKRLIEWLRISA